jgi:hypothetical protein
MAKEERMCGEEWPLMAKIGIGLMAAGGVAFLVPWMWCFLHEIVSALRG